MATLYADYEVKNQAGYGDGYSSYRTYDSMAQRITFSQQVVLNSVFAYYAGKNGAAAALHVLKIFRASDGAEVAGSGQNLWLIEVTGWNEYELPTPVVLEAGIEYSIGYHIPSLYDTFIAFDTSGTAQTLVGVSDPAGVSSSWWGQLYYATTDTTGVMPPTVLGDTLMIKLGVSLNTLPAAPTGVSGTGTQWPNNVPVSWTHSDPDSDPQSKYQVRWRIVD